MLSIRRRVSRLARRGVAASSKPLRHKFDRPDLNFKIAETPDEVEAAFRILHDAYVGMGFMRPENSGLRVTIHHAMPTTSTLVALRNGEVIATVSVICESPLGLPIEKIFDLSPARRGGARIAEISALAVKKEFRGGAGDVLFPLLKCLFTYCENHLSVDRLVIATHPKRSRFYERLFSFERLAPKAVANYDFVNGAPADGLVLDIERSVQTCSRELVEYFRAPSDAFAFPGCEPKPATVFLNTVDAVVRNTLSLLTKRQRSHG